MQRSRYEVQIRKTLGDQPSRVAIDFDGAPYYWGDAHKVTVAIERLVEDLGLREGERVGLMGRNLPAHFAALWGLFVSARCVSNIHVYQPANSLAVEFARNRWPLVLGDLRDWSEEVIAAADAVGTVGFALTADTRNPLQLVTQTAALKPSAERKFPGSTVIELLSSGTTGEPKRIELGRTAIDEMIERTISHFELTGPASGATQIMPWPLSSLGGTNAALPVAVLGQSMAIQEKFNASRMLEMIKKYKPAFLSIPPSAMVMILQLNPQREDLACIKLFSSGSAPLDPNVRSRLLQDYGVPSAEFYGATEFAGIVTGWTAEDMDRVIEKAGSVGRALPGIEIRIISPVTGQVLPAGEMGLVEALVPRTGPEWVRTNDLGRMDDEGFLYILGRADDTIIRGGLKVFPQEIVECLRTHDKVRDAAVIGIDDERLGSVPAAAVELRPGKPSPTPEELDAFLRTRLSPHKIPVRFVIVDEIPRTQSMKPQRQKMWALFT